MPIKKENLHLYGSRQIWNKISAEIKQRAGNKCEFCGVHQYAVGQRINGVFNYACGSAYYDQMQYSITHKEASNARDYLNEWRDPDEPKYIVIVLTVAHLDHNPENHDPANLKALCQKCHLAYDLPLHMANAAQTRLNNRAGLVSTST